MIFKEVGLSHIRRGKEHDIQGGRTVTYSVATRCTSDEYASLMCCCGRACHSLGAARQLYIQGGKPHGNMF